MVPILSLAPIIIGIWRSKQVSRGRGRMDEQLHTLIIQRVDKCDESADTVCIHARVEPEAWYQFECNRAKAAGDTDKIGGAERTSVAA